jgi:hypothetical protein
MKTSVIKLSRAKENFGQALNEFIQCIHKVSEDTPEKVVFDFNACTFFDPHITGGIVSLAKSLIEKGCKVEFVNPKDATLLTYLDTISFPNGVDFAGSSSEAINRNLMRFHTKTYLPIICFPTSLGDAVVREQIMTAIGTIFRNQLKLDGKIFQAISYMVGELAQNIIDHSQSPQGLIHAQYYPNKNYMDLCIADWGKGIFQSYIDSGKFKPKDNVEALEYAVKGRSTKNIPESRGFGLSTSRDMLVNGLGGRFFVLSGDTFFLELPNEAEKLVQTKGLDYKGCYVALRIPTQGAEKFDFYKFVE